MPFMLFELDFLQIISLRFIGIIVMRQLAHRIHSNLHLGPGHRHHPPSRTALHIPAAATAIAAASCRPSLLGPSPPNLSHRHSMLADLGPHFAASLWTLCQRFLREAGRPIWQTARRR